MSKALAVNATVSGRQRFFDFLYKWGMLLTVVLLVAVFGLASDNFLDPFNIINILRSIAIVTVIAIGVSISLTIGGFDLSVGSTASLANALVNRPHLLILDEPLHGAGHSFAQKLGQLLARLNRELGMTVLLAEQQLSFIRRVADRFCMLYRGRNVAQGHVNELDDELIAHWMSREARR